MEEPKPVHDIPPQNPIPNPNPPDKPSPTLSHQLPPPPPPPPPPAEPTSMPPPPTSAPVSMPPPPPPPPPAKSNKRPLEGNARIQDCGYFKIRAVLKDIRPYLLEVIRTVDFQNCKGADELRERLKLLMQLYKQMTAEGVTLTKCKNTSESQKLSSENGAAQNPEQLQDIKPAEQAPFKPSDNKEALDVEEQSCYIGGSAFGWNFITFASNKAVYYGRTKESFRAAQAAA